MIHVEGGNSFFAEAKEIQQQKFAERTADIGRIIKLLNDVGSEVPTSLKNQLKRRRKLEKKSS